MTMSWTDAIRRRLEETDSVVSVIVADADGSVPRGPGAWMLVHADGMEGTIGGGRLEWEAMATAREMLGSPGPGPDDGWQRALKDYPLGPDLEQCCGGFVRLLYERIDAGALGDLPDGAPDEGLVLHPVVSGPPPVFVDSRQAARTLPFAAAKPAAAMLSGQSVRETVLTGAGDESWLIHPVEPPAHPLFLYGAGHVGRALVRVLSDLPFEVTWVDTHRDRFPANTPDSTPDSVAIQCTDDPAAVAAAAPAGARHVVMTYSHQLDFDICAALIAQDNHRFAGLIGSATKKARFVKRFRDAGLPDAAIARLTCPIGLPGIDGKEPATIAVAVAAQLLHRLSKAEALSREDERVAG